MTLISGGVAIRDTSYGFKVVGTGPVTIVSPRGDSTANPFYINNSSAVVQIINPQSHNTSSTNSLDIAAASKLYMSTTLGLDKGLSAAALPYLQGTIASGAATLGTSAIASGTCASAVTIAAGGVATTDNIVADFNADPTSTTGYSPSSSGMLTIVKYPTSGNVNFTVCNNTSNSITPGAATLNWRVVR